MKKLIGLLAASGALALAGCASTPAQRLYAAGGTLTVAETAAYGYASLPTCPTGAPLCSQSAIVKDMDAAAQAALQAYTDAQAMVTNNALTPAQQQAAVDALTAEINKLTALQPKVTK